MSLEDELLHILREYGDYVSGSLLAKKLSISRSMVSKLIKSLRLRGFIIESHPRLGYRIIDEDDLSIAPAFLNNLRTRMTFKAVYLPYCETTQDTADYIASQGAPEGTLVICEVMSRGRGRLGRRWLAPKGGLWFTLILRPPRIKSLHILSLLTGLAVSKSIESILNLRTSVKWPNDVLIGDKKVSGILIEAKAEADKVKYVLVGIGVNVNNDVPQELLNIATSLMLEVGRKVPRVVLLRSILIHLDKYYTLLLEGKIDRIVHEYMQKSSTIGRYVAVRLLNGSVIRGLAAGIDSEGRLIVRDEEGIIHHIDAGDVIHLR